ncbi:sensor histidine kinase [Noviherbaspirillum malthae]|uniref:sensor histidine kinase n=1 Tax=Noviherbaspirillum malthae TaxID=1260987 RepID=UPI00188FF86E|nr:HAMP domain-containing sensor histidine kinase [Noviherbaspirillum malthae]
MKLSTFINDNMERIVAEWEAFAGSLAPDAEKQGVGLREHARDILHAIIADIEKPRPRQLGGQAEGRAVLLDGHETAAATYGALRHHAGFHLDQLSAEFLALRASVIRLWMDSGPELDALAFEQILHFNDAIDRALSEALARYAKEVERSRDMFLAILGHDLRTPLGAIIMTSQYLATPGIPKQKQDDAVVRLGRSAAAMSAMIKDLLEFTRSRLGGGVPVSPAYADIGKICQSALDEARIAYPRHEMICDTSGELSAVVDGERLRQVVANLLSNAARHGGREAPIVVAAQGESDRGDCIVIEVRNRGPAIAEDVLRVIFNPLVHVGADDGNESMPPANLGLGLFIAREIVAAHGGEITVTSTDAEGTVFRIVLPRAPAS